jgi:2'-5' RNA ligase
MSGNFFVAVVPPSSITGPLAAIQSLYAPTPDVTWEPESRLHVTVRFFGKVERADAVEAMRTLRSLTEVKGLRVGNRLRSFGGRVLYAPVFGLDDLASAVLEKTQDLGDLPKYSYTAHITLARARQGLTLSRLTQNLRGRFDVDELLLMESTFDDSGNAQYDIIKKVRLHSTSKRREPREPGAS